MSLLQDLCKEATVEKKRFELTEHTADIGLVAYGSNLAEAYANAAYGMFSIIADLEDVKEGVSRQVTIDADDPEMLLVDWLNELLYLFDVHKLLFRRFDIAAFTGGNLAATCHGERYDPARHHLKLGIKAATYHMLRVDSEKNMVSVIFDV